MLLVVEIVKNLNKVWKTFFNVSKYLHVQQIKKNMADIRFDLEMQNKSFTFHR